MGVIYDTHSILDNPVLYSNQVIILIFSHETFSLHSIDISQINLQHFMNSFFTTLRYVFLLFKETLSSLFYFKIKIKTNKKNQMPTKIFYYLISPHTSKLSSIYLQHVPSSLMFSLFL